MNEAKKRSGMDRRHYHFHQPANIMIPHELEQAKFFLTLFSSDLSRVRSAKLRSKLEKVKPKTPLDLSLNPAKGWSDGGGFSLDECRKVIEKYHFLPLGIGFVIRDGLVFIDLDSVLDDTGEIVGNPQLAPEDVRWIVDIADSYTEISASGHGLHILVKARFSRSLTKPFELAGTNKFCALTGRIFEGRDRIKENQAGVDAILERFFREKSDKPKKMVLAKAEEPEPSREGGYRRYFEAALEEELERVRSAPIGDRNNTLNRSAFAIGTLIGTLEPKPDISKIEDAFVRAAMEAGLSEREARATARSGLYSGMNEPRQLPEPSQKLPFTVLGFTLKREIMIWYKGRLFAIPTNRLSPDELTLFMCMMDKDEFKRVKQTILIEAHKRGVVDTDEAIQSGIWKEPDGFLIISGKRAAFFDGKELKEITEPAWRGRILNLHQEAWLNLDKLKKHLESAEITQIFWTIRELVNQWTFADGRKIDHLAAFVMLAPFQQAMEWRPWIYLTGRRGSGKTTFFNEVLGIYGNLTLRMDKTTAHALAQEFGATTKIPVLDEFEKYRRLEEILEVAKLANRGGVYTRGTTGESSRRWRFHHMFWFGSIYVAGQDAAQRSRMVIFELRPHENTNPRFLSLTEKEELRHEIIAAMLKSWPEIEARARHYFENKAAYGIEDGRIIDNLAYACALLDIADEERGEIPEWAYESETVEDEEELIAAILGSIIENQTVYEHLRHIDNEILEKYGLKYSIADQEEYLVIQPLAVRRHLLKDTEWKDADIASLLRRIGEEGRAKLQKQAQRVIKISLKLINDIASKYWNA
jgi:hypothetical protein